jgi:hypothetical protein
MTGLRELVGEGIVNEIVARHPKIPAEDVQILWHDHFWDGPLSGVCLYGEAKHYYRCIEEADEGPWYRRFALYALTPGQAADEEAWHELFREKVGTHWEPGGSLRPRELHHEFYDGYRERPDPNFEANNPVVGWFER